jgi:L-ribulose-5-phosphate 3-epimerase
MNNKIGIMQGRLLPKYNGRYQAHPVGYWQKEFYVAASLGIDLIQFIVDWESISENPVMTDDGIVQILNATNKTGISVTSICADCFMSILLHSKDREIARQSLNYLHRLIINASKLGISDIVIPCLDNSSLRTTDDKNRFVDAVEAVIDVAEENCINLSLETDLDPLALARLLERISSPRVTINYDTGNSASLGFNPKEELAVYGDRVSGIHIKDRKKGGKSVILGAGDADFSAFFQALNLIDYKGSFIFETYRDDEGIAVFKEQLHWIQPQLEAYRTRGSEHD